MLLLPKCVVGEIFTHGRQSCSVHVAVGRLGKVLVGLHFVKDSLEHLLHGGLAVPVLKEGELAGFKSSVLLVDGRNVDLRGEFHFHRLIGVVRPTSDRQEVDSVVKLAVGRSDNSTVPISKSLIRTIVETVR